MTEAGSIRAGELKTRARQGTFCDRCGAYAISRTKFERGEATFTCAACGHTVMRLVAPLLIVTGASGVGKTSVIEHLQRDLTEFLVLDKDAIWAVDNDMVCNNLFRVASAAAQGGRPTMVVGTMLPEMIDDLSDRHMADPVIYANLHCDDATRRHRLLSRRTWGPPDEDFIAEHARFAKWLLDNAATAFDPPMPTFETGSAPPEDVARAVTAWARSVVG